LLETQGSVSLVTELEMVRLRAGLAAFLANGDAG
jgi:hypothetical protein